mmetsp:Transcript_23450/g.51017  ORF Transcript_23450/g.51017 Transcript_23450/m.51017 type:complete len:224 (-) Transcript_23450:91-762(-)
MHLVEVSDIALLGRMFKASLGHSSADTVPVALVLHIRPQFTQRHRRDLFLYIDEELRSVSRRHLLHLAMVKRPKEVFHELRLDHLDQGEIIRLLPLRSFEVDSMRLDVVLFQKQMPSHCMHILWRIRQFDSRFGRCRSRSLPSSRGKEGRARTYPEFSRNLQPSTTNSLQILQVVLLVHLLLFEFFDFPLDFALYGSILAKKRCSGTLTLIVGIRILIVFEFL